MAEELDAGLVETVARRIRQSDAVRDTEYEPIIADVYRRNARAALAATGIPAAALNALARGEATVVSRTAVTQAGNVLFNLKQRMPGSKLQEPDLRSMAEVSALLDASTYAAKE